MKTLTTHYSLESDEYSEAGICNTNSENLKSDWDLVSCKKCLNLREQFEIKFARDEKECVKQMGEMYEFYNKQNKRNKDGNILFKNIKSKKGA